MSSSLPSVLLPYPTIPAPCNLTVRGSAARGFRSDTIHEPKRDKNEIGTNCRLDQRVGCNRLLASLAYFISLLFMKTAISPSGKSSLV